jgi:hypothetical protein
MSWHSKAETIHRGAYVQDADPTGNSPNLVQPFVQWVKTGITPVEWYYRNSGNSAWVLIGKMMTFALDTDGTLAANSDSVVATQKAVKTYADSLIAANDAAIFKGAINASGNPNYPAADAGWFYKISVAGKIGGSSGINVEVGDSAWCLVDSSASGNQVTVGANWVIIQGNIDGALTTGSIGVSVQAYNAILAALAGLTGAANKLAYFTGSSSMAVTDLSAFIRTLLDDADAATARATLGAAALEILQNIQTANYTAVLADSGKHIYHPVSDDNARTFTIPANGSVAYPIGTAITFINEKNVVTIAITTDTLLFFDGGTGGTGSRTLAANGIATALKVDSTKWIISGVGLT